MSIQVTRDSVKILFSDLLDPERGERHKEGRNCGKDPWERSKE